MSTQTIESSNEDSMETEEEQLHERYTETTRAALDSQRDVTTAFLEGRYPPQTSGKIYSSPNFKAYQREDGTGEIRHYRTTETIRTRNGLILTNAQCYSGGFARCSKPASKKRAAEVPLTLVDRLTSHIDSEFGMYAIQDVERDGRHYLLDLPEGQILVGRDPTHTDHSHWFGFALSPEDSAEDPEAAISVLRPSAVSDDAKRQGEWWLVPMGDSWTPSAPTKKCLSFAQRNSDWRNLDRAYDAEHIGDRLPTECSRCGGKSFELEPKAPVSECTDCGMRFQTGDRNFVPGEIQDRYDGAEQTLGSHTPRDLAVEPDGSTYVRGTFRHQRNEHQMIDLGEEWHRAVTHDRDVLTVDASAPSRAGRYD